MRNDNALKGAGDILTAVKPKVPRYKGMRRLHSTTVSSGCLNLETKLALKQSKDAKSATISRAGQPAEPADHPRYLEASRV